MQGPRSFLHGPGDDLVELVLADNSVTVEIGSLDEFVKLFFADVLSKFTSDSLEGGNIDVALSLVIVECEDFTNVSSGVLIVDSLGHEGEPLSEVDAAVSVGVHVGDHLEGGCALGLESEGGHGCLEFWVG